MHIEKSDATAIKVSSPNHDPSPITVEYVILHYTACDLPTTLKIFTDPERKASSHLVIDTNGDLYETVACLNGTALRAWHAGKSTYLEGAARIEGFNDRSIGIELVNFNGNIFGYTDAQYNTLSGLFRKLREFYPALKFPERVLGHEDIAGFRGKSDPGCKFDWPRFFGECYPGEAAPQRQAIIDSHTLSELEKKAALAPLEIGLKNEFFMSLSSELEANMKRT